MRAYLILSPHPPLPPSLFPLLFYNKHIDLVHTVSFICGVKAVISLVKNAPIITAESICPVLAVQGVSMMNAPITEHTETVARALTCTHFGV